MSVRYARHRRSLANGGDVRFARSARNAAVAGLLVCGLAACTATNDTAGSGSAGSVGSSPTVTMTPTGSAEFGQSTSSKPVSAYCTKLRAAGARIQAAQVQMYTGAGSQASSALTALESELGALKSGAPASIKAALTDLANAFRQAQSLLAHPSSSSGTALAQISSKLASDAQAITGYVASQC
jgi:hypothetical protein